MIVYHTLLDAVFFFMKEIKKMEQPTPTAPPISRSHTIAITLGTTIAVVMVIACLLNMAYRNRKFPFSRKTNYELRNNTTK